SQRLVMEGNPALGIAHCRDRRVVRIRRGVGIAEELHEAAERNGADLPARAVAIVPAEQLAAEADGEYLDPHAAAARHPVVSQFVDEYDDRKNDDERDDVSGEIGNEIHRHLGHRLSGPSPSSRLYPYDIP